MVMEVQWHGRGWRLQSIIAADTGQYKKFISTIQGQGDVAIRDECTQIWVSALHGCYRKITQGNRRFFLPCIYKSLAPLKYARIWDFRTSYPGVPGHIQRYTTPYLSFNFETRGCCEMNEFHVMYRGLMPDLIIEGRQLFPVRFSAEKYHWSSIFSCGISPAKAQMLDLSPRLSNLLDSQSTWQMMSQSTGHSPLCFFNFFFFLLISLSLGFLWLKPPIPKQSWTVEHGCGWQRVLAMLVDFRPLKAKQVDFFFNKKKIFVAKMK